MRCTPGGAKRSSERMKPGACEHASLTETTMVTSASRSSAGQAGYFGSMATGFLGMRQLRVIITSGTNSPT